MKWSTSTELPLLANLRKVEGYANKSIDDWNSNPTFKNFIDMVSNDKLRCEIDKLLYEVEVMGLKVSAQILAAMKRIVDLLRHIKEYK